MTKPLFEDDDACRERLSALMDGELTGAELDRACGHWRDAPDSRATWHAFHLIGDVLRSDDLAGGAERNAAFVESLRVRMRAEHVVLAPARRAAEDRADLDAAAGTTTGTGPHAGIHPIDHAGYRAETDLPVAGTHGWPLSRGRAAGRPWAGWRSSATFAAGMLAAASLLLVVRAPSSTVGSPRLAVATLDDTTTAQPASSGGGVARVSLAPPVPAPGALEPRELRAGDPLIRDARLDRRVECGGWGDQPG